MWNALRLKSQIKFAYGRFACVECGWAPFIHFPVDMLSGLRLCINRRHRIKPKFGVAFELPRTIFIISANLNLITSNRDDDDVLNEDWIRYPMANR
jgi:hypothetical protein